MNQHRTPVVHAVGKLPLCAHWHRNQRGRSKLKIPGSRRLNPCRLNKNQQSNGNKKTAIKAPFCRAGPGPISHSAVISGVISTQNPLLMTKPLRYRSKSVTVSSKGLQAPSAPGTGGSTGTSNLSLQPFSVAELDHECKTLPPDKSPGPCGTTNRMLKASGPAFREFFNTPWTHDTHPQAWQQSLLQPITKARTQKDKKKTDWTLPPTEASTSVAP